MDEMGDDDEDVDDMLEDLDNHPFNADRGGKQASRNCPTLTLPITTLLPLPLTVLLRLPPTTPTIYLPLTPNFSYLPSAPNFTYLPSASTGLGHHRHNHPHHPSDFAEHPDYDGEEEEEEDDGGDGDDDHAMPGRDMDPLLSLRICTLLCHS